MTTTKVRVGDCMVITTVEEEPAIVSFQDILDATTVEGDDWSSSAPWKECDGYEHELVRVDTGIEGMEHRRGLCKGDRCVVVSKEQADEWGIAAWHRARGASKQVAAEAQADNVARTIDQLVKWYEHGWTYYCVSCDFHGYQDSVGGILDDEGAYLEDTRREIASRVAAQMRKDGYTVEGEPANDYYSREKKQERLRWHIAHNLGFDKPTGYLAWLRSHGKVA